MPADRLAFRRATVLPGVTIERFEGRLAKMINARLETLPVSPQFIPTHALLVDCDQYLTSLDERLKTEGKSREPPQLRDFPDIDGIKRQVLVAITLCGRLAWDVGGQYTIHRDEQNRSKSVGGYAHLPAESVSDLIRWTGPIGGFKTVAPSSMKRLCEQLDCYYRTGTWWVDRLSVALGYLWSALTTTQSELAFAALCMAVEAVATSSQNEVTHILAERCAILGRPHLTDRLALYSEVKDLYTIRSKIVHGRSAPRKGIVNAESLAITAKRSIVPRTAVSRMLAVTIDVISGVLKSPELLKLLHVNQSEEKANEAINVYFQSLLLR